MATNKTLVDGCSLEIGEGTFGSRAIIICSDTFQTDEETEGEDSYSRVVAD